MTTTEGAEMTTTKQRTRTDFLCLTISAGAGKLEQRSSHGENYRYNVQVQSDATGAVIRFEYHDSIARADAGTDQLDRENLLYALWSFARDAQAGAESFHHFCADFGYSTDSREALRTHKACKASARKFARLFHDDRSPSWALDMLEHAGIS